MIDLIEYTSKYENETLKRMADFFGFHIGLYNANISLNEASFTANQETIDTLEKWISKNHALYIILYDIVPVGFVHICYRGGNVAWIEDIYVDKERRGEGIASQAIKLAEEIIAKNKDYDAVCIDVVMRNIEALKLYFRLGYTNLSMITVRKELYKNENNKEVNLLGFDFKY
ncbi:MAG: GNAT family N-acetyltransferase [Oscillospiraceae bacterium]|nr:GNAT family N-acetyltransferase [Oscillospiraceae bacterium]